VSAYNVRDAALLIVDDEPTGWGLLKEILAARGFNRIDIATSGQEALEKIKQRPYDLVLLDLVMPDVDGFTVCRTIRNSAGFERLPIIVQTYLDKPGDRARAFAAGATDLVAKPINAAELEARVRIHLENRAMLAELSLYKQRLESEMDAAQRIQNAAVPQRAVYEALAESHNLHVDGYLRASSQLGGDSWSIRRLDTTKVSVYTLDFSGHGVNAALNAVRLDALMSGAVDKALDPAAMLQYLNAEICRVVPVGQFATLFYGVLDCERRVLRYASAGAPPVLYWSHHSAPPEAWEGSDLALGLSSTTRYTEKTATFAPGAQLFLYSDGLTYPFGGTASLNDAGVQALLSETDMSRAFRLLRDRVEQDFPQPLRDDVTLVAIRQGETYAS